MSAHSSAPSASITLFRRLVWEGTVPLEIKIDTKELPAGSDRGLDSYFIQAPRVSYLPLLIPDIRRHLAELIFDEREAASIKEEDWWFEADTGALMKWHWPIGLLYDHHTTTTTVNPTASFSHLPHLTTPLRLTLHLASPPTDKLLLSSSAESCKQAFMGQLKEADFLRWGNTKRVTGLRKAEQDGIWEGVRDHNFDDYWRVAGKITPTTSPLVPSPSHMSPQGSHLHSRPPSTDPAGPAPDRDGAYNVRSVPARIYLPEGPVLQDLVPPLAEDGRPTTVQNFLETHLPLLFPTSGPQLAYPLVHGVVVPPETEMAWLGASMAGADGWVCVCIGLGRGPV